MLDKKVEREQAQAAQAANGADAYNSGQPDADASGLKKETEERLRQYTTAPEPFPVSMRPEAFHGVIGQITKLMVEHCESSPEVLLVHGLAIVGNIIGRSAYVYGGGPYLFPNEFAVFVGETARGRKGTALQMWWHLIELVNPDWLNRCSSSQVQSGEGIVYRIRDELRGIPKGKRQKPDEPPEEVILDAGVSDKRLLVVEEEFAHTPKMGERSGNTLSVTLRHAWDSPPFLKNDNKNSPLKASDPHVSMIGHTTRDELLDTLSPIELKNGMANRVLWCAARRTGDMPDAEPINWRNYSNIIDRLKEVFRQRPANTCEPEFFSRAPARNYWDALYRKLNAEKRDSTMDAILARDTSHILKLALVFAIVDQASQIETQHVKAALAVVDFCQASARWIFGQATGNKLANNIIWELRRFPNGLTRTEIHQNVCYGRTPKTQLDRALTDLLQNGLAEMTLEQVAKGPRTERWFAKR